MFLINPGCYKVEAPDVSVAQHLNFITFKKNKSTRKTDTVFKIINFFHDEHPLLFTLSQKYFSFCQEFLLAYYYSIKIKPLICCLI